MFNQYTVGQILLLKWKS